MEKTVYKSLKMKLLKEKFDIEREIRNLENKKDLDLDGLNDYDDEYDDNYDLEDNYNRQGFNMNGIHRNGTLYDNDGYDEDGYDEDGFSRENDFLSERKINRLKKRLLRKK